MVSLPIDDRGLDVQPIMRDEILYASTEPAHVRSAGHDRGLAGAPLILADATYGTEDPMRRQLAELAQRAGVSIEPQIEVEDVEAALELAARGLGDTIVSRGMLLAWAGASPGASAGCRSTSPSTRRSRSSRAPTRRCRPRRASSSGWRARRLAALARRLRTEPAAPADAGLRVSRAAARRCRRAGAAGGRRRPWR